MSLLGLSPLLSSVPAYRRVADGLVAGGHAEVSVLEQAKPYVLGEVYTREGEPAAPWIAVGRRRRRAGRSGRFVERATASARSEAWSYPRSNRRKG